MKTTNIKTLESQLKEKQDQDCRNILKEKLKERQQIPKLAILKDEKLICKICKQIYDTVFQFKKHIPTFKHQNQLELLKNQNSKVEQENNIQEPTHKKLKQDIQTIQDKAQFVIDEYIIEEYDFDDQISQEQENFEFIEQKDPEQVQTQNLDDNNEVKKMLEQDDNKDLQIHDNILQRIKQKQLEISKQKQIQKTQIKKMEIEPQKNIQELDIFNMNWRNK